MTPIFHLLSDAPKPVAPYSHAVDAGAFARVPQGCSLTLADAAMVSILLKNFEHDYAKMNEIYATYFHADKRPSRTTVGITTLARSGIVEMDMIAVRP
jgi:2-iminobutanoate/2-iminopropanoate deaminase